MNAQYSELTARELKTLVRSFRQLQKVVRKPLPRKKKALWEEVMREAEKKIIEELKQRQKRFTLRPDVAQRVPTHLPKESLEPIIQGRAEKKYGERDKRYASRVDKRREMALARVKEIDHFLTPRRHKLMTIPEAQKTLLVADWKKLREEFSIDEIMNFDQHELFDRTISSLKAFSEQPSQPGAIRRLWPYVLDLWERIWVAAFEALRGKA